MFRQKGKTLGITVSLGVVVLFFVTISCFLEVLKSKVVTDVTMIPSCQFLIDRSFREPFSEEFLDSIPNAEFKYTASISRANMHISPEIKNEELKEYYNAYAHGMTAEEMFQKEITNVEIVGISKEAFDNFEWFDEEPLDYDEWAQSKKALVDDISVKTDEDGNKTYRHILNIDANGYTFKYDGRYTDFGDGNVTEYAAGEIELCGRVGNKLYCREDNSISISFFFPEEYMREIFDPYFQCIYINAKKGKETELGMWLRNNAVKYGYGVQDDVKKYAAAHDTQTTKKVILAAVFIIVTLISIIHIYNTVKGNLGIRRKELAILMAVGMRRWQIQKGVLWEHAIYGLMGGVLGSVISILILKRLLLLLSGASSISMVIPWNYIITGVSLAVIISMAVAFFTTIKVGTDGIAKEVREND